MRHGLLFCIGINIKNTSMKTEVLIEVNNMQDTYAVLSSITEKLTDFVYDNDCFEPKEMDKIIQATELLQKVEERLLYRAKQTALNLLKTM